MAKCAKPNHSHGCTKDNTSPTSLEAIIEEYIKKYSFQDCQRYWVDINSIGDCVLGCPNDDYTCREALMPSIRDHHQCCLTTDLVIDYVRKLEGLLPSLKVADFDALWQEISKLDAKGIGPVTRYDTALRYSLWKKLPEPEYVYLHSEKGPLKGAKAYFKYKGLATVTTPTGCVSVDSLKPGCRVDISNFPDFVQSGLDAKNIENLLCIHSEALSKLHGMAKS